MELKTIVALFGLNAEELDIDPIFYEDGNDCIITATLKETKKRECPSCHSNEVIIKEKRPSNIKLLYSSAENKNLKLRLFKNRFICKNCGLSYTDQPKNLVIEKGIISNKIRWKVFELTQHMITYKEIGRQLSISTPSVISIFDEMVKVEREKFSKVICIDEKRFPCYKSKYMTVISDGLNGNILDLVGSRTKDVMNEYFAEIPASERAKVQFFSSDMFQGFKRIKAIFFPNAIHIIDFFHVKKLFTTQINIIRNQVIKANKFDNPKDLAILKNDWQYLLFDPYVKHKYKPKEVVDEEGEIIDKVERIARVANKYPSLHFAHSLYLDYCFLMRYGESYSKTQSNLEFIINRANESPYAEIKKIGVTLMEFYYEILNTYSDVNIYKTSNAISEANNNKIASLIKISYGLKDFARLRKRILHIEKNKKTKER